MASQLNLAEKIVKDGYRQLSDENLSSPSYASDTAYAQSLALLHIAESLDRIADSLEKITARRLI
ncbi:hypothetical protein [Bifidobacterium callitrichidarum]|uniref:HEPN domain-containing protein n=1 Tax=Bifidobacterium callitrichidarum TaxID=2052941 RepID=A0A2U2NC20_9BIFI|nr:hypothetical protein [Bifidobacterium callitrichidarum]PWG66630.1 hypothetical protein DF196_01640 [Bifidobacterium callitrichidarum]